MIGPLKLSTRVGWIYGLYGVGGRTVQKMRDCDLHQVAKCKPDILVLEIDANDLAELAPEVVPYWYLISRVFNFTFFAIVKKSRN